MISLVINCDTRPGCDDLSQTVGDHRLSDSCSLNGVRSWDFLTDGVLNKRAFLARNGEEIETILYIDEHDPIPMAVQDMLDMLQKNGKITRLVCRSHDRTHPRWNDLIYLEALSLATGDYVAHFDGDCAAFKNTSWYADEFYRNLVDMADGPRFVCQPTPLTKEEHGMDWASTRFFFCRRESLDLPELLAATLDETHRTYKYGFAPALEHLIGKMAFGKVLYPPAAWDSYMIFSWARYHRGLLYALTGMPYARVKNFITLTCGIHGPNDVISQPLG